MSPLLGPVDIEVLTKLRELEASDDDPLLAYTIWKRIRDEVGSSDLPIPSKSSVKNSLKKLFKAGLVEQKRVTRERHDEAFDESLQYQTHAFFLPEALFVDEARSTWEHLDGVKEMKRQLDRERLDNETQLRRLVQAADDPDDDEATG